MAESQFRRGDVVRVELNTTRGGEQKGDARPCVVVQNDLGNRYANTTIIVPATDAAGKEAYPFQVLIPKGEGGLTKESLLKCEQIRVISKERIKGKIGSLTEASVHALNQALINSLGL